MFECKVADIDVLKIGLILAASQGLWLPVLQIEVVIHAERFKILVFEKSSALRIHER